MLQIIVTDMKSKATDYGWSQYGFAVLDNRGRQIGVWYSILTATAPVRMLEDKKVIIYTPDVDTYGKHDDNPLRRDTPVH
jgi:hypothetical protein